ncbi:chymotrypsin-like elastase family member 2A [Oppia nitens]|uniref:chymotrypsin-like elastase family member 2A n=1 Tax=Oppia nitens TaxID=1686743 RepID=UPI0023D9A354|nr:chymotrypsin-like elastase family member 2A [Oppia nitens]
MIIYLLFGFIVLTYGLHTRIQHYPSVTEDNCGINSQSLLMSGHCLKWSSNMTTNVQNGRLAQPFEWPWIAFIDIYKTFWGFKYDRFWCTGVILNRNWIITAAHCLESDYTINVRLVQDYSQQSHSYGVDMYVIHPNYTALSHTVGLRDGYDIALLKLDSQILMTQSTGGYPTVNAICLPDRDIVNTDKELAVFAGFGDINDNIDNSGPLRTGWFRMTESFDNPMDRWTYLIRCERFPINKGTAACIGDSGGPLVQYAVEYNGTNRLGRAVLIGLNKGMNPEAITCPSKFDGTINVFVRISKHIDWIINTVVTNT